MSYIEKSAKTVDEAVAAALDELGISADQADITVIDQGKPGMFLGFGAKPAIVRVMKKEEEVLEKIVETPPVPPVEEAPVQIEKVPVQAEEETPVKEEVKACVVDEAAVARAKDFLQKIFAAMKIDVVMEKFVNSKDGSVTIRLHGDDMGILIGKHGQTLDSLQYLTNLVANKSVKDRIRVIIDVEDYRDRRVETLTRLARRLADKVRHDGEQVALEPMNPHERKIIHMALQGDRKVTTFSVGEDPNRYVVISLKK